MAKEKISFNIDETTKKKVKVISPEVDTRAKGDYIESRNGLWLELN